MHTADGGASWKKVEIGTRASLSEVEFVDSLHGWIMGDGVCFRTENGGNNWIQVAHFGTANHIVFVDTAIGYCVGVMGYMGKTINSGRSWTHMVSGVSGSMNDLAFTSPDTGWAVGDEGVIVKTVNGGATWTRQISGTTKHFYSVNFLNSKIGFAVGAFGVLVNTNDGGSTWQLGNSSVGTNLFWVKAVNPSLLYASGTSRVFLKSVDGGNTWSQFFNPASGYATGYCEDDSTVWVAGGLIITKTTTGGRTWETYTRKVSNNDLYGCHYLDDANAWVCGHDGIVFHTSNGGSNWMPQHSALTLATNIFFKTMNLGWISGIGAIARTTNGGLIWDTIRTGLAGTLLGMSFPTASDGWVCRDNGQLARTRDSGKSWALLPSLTGSYFTEIQFLDTNTGYALATFDGKIWKTRNGGISW